MSRALQKRDWARELADETNKIASKFQKIVDAASLASLPDHAIEDIDDAQVRKIAKDAQLPRSEVPFYVQMAHDYEVARIKNAHKRAEPQFHLNIKNAAVSIPPKQEKKKDSEVIIVEAEVEDET